MAKQFRDFESAREYVRKLGLSGEHEWREYCKSGNKPDDIPSSPKNNYKNDFKGVGDWLGTGSVASFNRQFLEFSKAREFVQTLGLSSQREWYAYCKSGEKPNNLPSTPQEVYKKQKTWKGWGDFLGTGTVAPQFKQFYPFNEAREFVQTLGIKSVSEWKEYCKSGKKPNNLPSTPQEVYKKQKTWKGWGDFFGTGRIADRDKIFHPFNEAREFVRELNLKSQKEWNEYCKSGEKPKKIPNAPALTYKNKGWTTWGEWFGTGTVATQDRKYRSYKEAREFVRALNLKGTKEWREYCKSGDKPDDIPSNPWDIYKEWKKK
jgi:hypothetical protein